VKKRKKYRYIVMRCAKRRSGRETWSFRGVGGAGRVSVCVVLGDPKRHFGTRREAMAQAKFMNTGPHGHGKHATYKVFRVTRIM